MRSVVILRPDRPLIVDEKAKEAGRVALTEIFEEPTVRGVVVPALADEGGTDEGGGEADAQEDLDEEVVVLKHFGHGGCSPRWWGMPLLCPAIRTFCVVGTDQPGKKLASQRQCRLLELILLLVLGWIFIKFISLFFESYLHAEFASSMRPSYLVVTQAC